MKRRRMASPSPPSSSSPSSWRLAVTTALALLVSPSTASSYAHSGNGTAFFHGNISNAGCGFMSWPTLANTHYAAVLRGSSTSKTPSTATTSACGRCARVWCIDDRCLPQNNTNTLVYIVEDDGIRPGIVKDLNLAPSAFRTITGFSSGRVDIRWRFTDCPTEEPVADYEDSPAPSAICVNRDSSPYWLALQPVNDTLGIDQVDVNGTRAELKASSPYFFTLADPLGRLNLKQLEISITTRSRRRFKKVVSVLPGDCVGVYLADELPLVNSGSSSSDGSGSHASSWAPLPSTRSPFVPASSSPVASSSPSTARPPATSKPRTATPQPTSKSPATTTPKPSNDGGPIDEPPRATNAAVTPKPPTQRPRTHTPRPPSPATPPATTPPASQTPSSSSSGPVTTKPQATPSAPSPPAIAPFPPPSDNKETPGSPSTVTTPIASKASDTPLDPNGSIPAIKTTDIPSGGSGPATLDKNGHPTSEPAAAAPGSQPSGVTTTRPLVSPSPPVESGGSNNSQPPKPTPAGGPASTLTRGVLTSPLFIGLLLGSVGFVGAIVAYRAKSRQQHLLAMAPPVTSANATPRHTSRAAYSSDPALSAL